MPSGNDRRYQRALETIEQLRAKSGDGKGRGNLTNTSDKDASWHCRDCGYYNFGSRRSCRKCPTSRPSTTTPSSAPGQHLGKGGNGGGKSNGTKGKGRRDGGTGTNAEGQNHSRLLAQLEELKEQNRTLKAGLAEKAAQETEKDDDDAELLDDEDEGDAAVAADLEHLPALQRLYDAALVQLGADDASAKALRSRLEAARAKQRAAKPILQQVQTSQRKAARLERQLEAAKTKLQQLEEQRADLDKEIAEQAAKVASSTEDVTKARGELGQLLERAKAEKGTAVPPPTTTSTTTDGSAPTSNDLQGAAAAWNAAKLAIQHQVAALPAELNQEVTQAIAAQYAAMEALLNKLPPPAPAATPPGTGEQAGAQGRQCPPTPTAPATAAAASTSSAPANPGGAGRGIGTEGNAEEDEGPADMLDVDDSVLARLAEIFTADADEGAVADGGAAGNDGDGDEDDSGGSRKTRKLLDSRVTAAKQYLAGRIPLRKPQLKKGGGK